MANPWAPSGSGSGRSSAQPGSNNPFAAHVPSVLQSAASRFPELPPDEQQGQAGQQQQFSYGAQQQQDYAYQQQLQAQAQQQQMMQQQGGFTGYEQQQQQPQPQMMYSQPTGRPGGFQPSSHFGQQLASQIPPAQSPRYASEFDPYAQLGDIISSGAQSGPSGHGQHQSQGQQGQGQGQGQMMGMQPPPQDTHPRQYVLEQRNGLAAWDPYTWKQLLNKVDALRGGWEHRKRSAESLRGSGGDEGRVGAIIKDADEKIDGIHAAKFQLEETFNGFRHSNDSASKSRVREALNAGLRALPEYPAAISPDEVGGNYYQRAAEDMRKQQILQGFGGQQPQQQQQAYYQQPQATGWPQQQQQQQGYPQQHFQGQQMNQMGYQGGYF